MKLGQILARMRMQLQGISESAGLDAQVLAAHVLGVSRTWLLAHPEHELSEKQEGTLFELSQRIANGEPLPYVRGHWEFFGLDFKVTPAVLIPRPETELLVEQALSWLQKHAHRRLAADIGTGSGCIAITLAVKIRDLHVTAVDLDNEALMIAQENAVVHHVASRIDFIKADLFPQIDPAINQLPFDLVCANLPYIPETELEVLPVARHEPRRALAGGSDGLDLIRRFLIEAPMRLASGGLMLLEIETNQGIAAHEASRAAFPDAEIDILHDLAGHDRIVRIRN